MGGFICWVEIRRAFEARRMNYVDEGECFHVEAEDCEGDFMVLILVVLVM